MTLKPIGHVKSVYQQKFGTPRQSLLVKEARGCLVLDKGLVTAQSLEGLGEFSHIWLVFQFHLNQNQTISAKVAPPRLDGKKVGFFATRSPHRINSLGLSCVKLEKVKYPNLYLSGVDLVEGTPVFDIKPYVKEYDSHPSATSGWLESLVEPELYSIKFSDEVNLQLNELQKQMIVSTLKHDPRPISCKKISDDQSYQMLLDSFDVHFKYVGVSEILVDKIIVF